MKNKILAIDDEEFNLDIISEYLEDAGYEVILASDGLEGIAALEKHPDVSAIVLDRMMPNMDGITFLQTIKKDLCYEDIPVIMQTAAAASKQVLEGIQAGAYYYLTKPYDESLLLSIVHAAVNNAQKRDVIMEEVHQHKEAVGLIQSATIHFKNLEEAQSVAYFLSNQFPHPEQMVMGLLELLVNAVEHGNLGITYNEKKQMIMEGRWHTEVARRLTLPENLEKQVVVFFEKEAGASSITITDQGDGFDWRRYQEIDPERLTDPNGRGIVTAKMFSFSQLVYNEVGNQVKAIARLA